MTIKNFEDAQMIRTNHEQANMKLVKIKRLKSVEFEEHTSATLDYKGIKFDLNPQIADEFIDKEIAVLEKYITDLAKQFEEL